MATMREEALYPAGAGQSSPRRRTQRRTAARRSRHAAFDPR